MFTRLIDLFIGEWIWSMMYGWAYICSYALCATIVLKRFLPTSYIKSLCMSIGASVVAFIIYSSLIIILSTFFIHPLHYHPTHIVQKPFIAHLLLATVYTVFQIMYFVVLHRIFRVNIKKALLGSFISSLAATIISYLYLRLSIGIIFMHPYH